MQHVCDSVCREEERGERGEAPEKEFNIPGEIMVAATAAAALRALCYESVK